MPSIHFFSNQFPCIIPQFHKSLTNFNISYTMHYQTLTITHLICQNPNLIHGFLNLSQNHHHSILNATNLTSIQENQIIRYEKHKNPTFPPLKTYFFLVFLGSSLLIPLVDHLKSLNEEKKITSHTWPFTFSSCFPFLSFLFSLFFPLLSLLRVLLLLRQLNLLNYILTNSSKIALSYLQKLPLNQISSLVHSNESQIH